jgi:V/A-type H+-transporting ATPase subunit K
MGGKQAGWVTFVSVLVLVTFFAPMAIAAAQGEMANTAPAGGQVTDLARPSMEVMAIVISTAFVVGTACLAAGYAVARVGAAALGAASERPEMLGRSLILVGLAEGIAIYGLIIGIMLLRLMG